MLGATDVFVLLWFVLPSPETGTTGRRSSSSTSSPSASPAPSPASSAADRQADEPADPGVARVRAGRRPIASARSSCASRCSARSSTRRVDGVGGSASSAERDLVGRAGRAGRGRDLPRRADLRAVVYLLVERIMRPVTARALASGRRGGGCASASGPARARLAVGDRRAAVRAHPRRGRALAFGGASAEELARHAIAMGGVAGAAGSARPARRQVVADPLRSVRKALGKHRGGRPRRASAVDDGRRSGSSRAASTDGRGPAGARAHARPVRPSRRRGRRRGGARHRPDRARRRGPRGRRAVHRPVGSTSLAATRPPREVVRILNDFFAVVVEVVGREGGWVNKFEGDAALCVLARPAITRIARAPR